MCDLCNVAVAGVPAAGAVVTMYRHRLGPIVRWFKMLGKVECAKCGTPVKHNKTWPNHEMKPLCKICYMRGALDS